jgi:adenylate cyclase
VLEGPEKILDDTLAIISQDTRHYDVVILKTESGVLNRLFPSWNMKQVAMDDMQLYLPLKVLLQGVTESHSILSKYTQPTILNFMKSGVNPLKTSPRKVERITMFCDIVSVSRLHSFLTKCSLRQSQKQWTRMSS